MIKTTIALALALFTSTVFSETRIRIHEARASETGWQAFVTELMKTGLVAEDDTAPAYAFLLDTCYRVEVKPYCTLNANGVLMPTEMLVTSFTRTNGFKDRVNVVEYRLVAQPGAKGVHLDLPKVPATATPAVVPAASAPKVTPLQATPPAAASAEVVKQLAERFDKRLGDQQTAQERAETLRVEAEKKFADKIRELEGKLKDAPNQATIAALQAEIATTKIANSQAEDARKRALNDGIKEVKVVHQEMKDSFLYRIGDWIWLVLGIMSAAIIGAYLYAHKQGRTLRQDVNNNLNEKVTTAMAPVLEKAQNAATLAEGADGVVQHFAAQVTKNEGDIARANAALSGLQAQVAETTKRLEVVEEVLGIDPHWKLDPMVRQAIFDTCFDLAEGASCTLPVRVTQEVTRYLRVTRTAGDMVFVEGLSQQSPRNAVKITELGRIITKAYHQKTLTGVEPTLALAQAVA